ncbi:MAG: translation elongation factor Ts [Candidatus Promineifilaceae bacterium]
MNITVDMVRELRELTGAGVLEAKKALEAAGGNVDRAIDALREKGTARAAKRAGREASEGLIEVYAHPGGRVGVLVELNCESDFVARNAQFQELAHNLALQVAAAQPRYLAPEDVPQAELEREMSVLRAQVADDGRPAKIVEKIVSGRMQKYYEEVCLLEQPFIRDESIKIRAMVTDAARIMGENILVRRFVRYELGEGL